MINILLFLLISTVKVSEIRGRALILFDPITSPKSQYAYYLTDVYQLENLLGHFKYTYYHHPIDDYMKGEIFKYDAVFYFGSVMGVYTPKDFLTDILNYKKPVVWFKHNFNNFEYELGIKTGEVFGFFVNNVSYGYNKKGRTGFYRYVTYKGIKFSKWFKVDPNGDIEWDPEIAVVGVHDPQKARIFLKIDWWGYGKPERAEIPYIIKSGNFWFVADDPFSYTAPYTPYVIFCDVLHDILKQYHHQPPRALVRLEDISPLTDPEDVKTAVDYLVANDIPFSMAVIPIYRNPHQNLTVYLHEKKELVDVLKYAVNHGGYIFMHGVSHQQDITPWQKYNETGTAYEFFDFDLKTPVPGDNVIWVYQRIHKGLQEFRKVGLPVTGFEVPHYGASRLDFAIFGRIFDLNYHRPAIFIDSPNIVPYDNQFFPYVIFWDIYGETLIPENLGYIGNYLGERLSPDSIISHARYILAVRDGIASFFWHPALARQMDEEHFFGIEALKKVIRNLQAMGYTFVGPKDLIEIKEYFR